MQESSASPCACPVHNVPRQEERGQAVRWHSQGTSSIPGPCCGGLQPSPSLCKPARPWRVLGCPWAHKCPFAGCWQCPSTDGSFSPALCLQVLCSLIHILFLFSAREQVRGINPDLHFLNDTASLSRELEALNSSLFAINSQYQSKKTQFEASRSTDLSGTALQLQHLFIRSY